MSIEQLWIKAFLVSDLFQSFLPEIPAHSFHHMQSGQNHQIRLELLQTGHERLQRAHFTVGHVMGQDKAVSLRSSWGAPLFTCREKMLRHKPNGTTVTRLESSYNIRFQICHVTEIKGHVVLNGSHLTCTPGWGGTHPSPAEILVGPQSVHPAYHEASAPPDHIRGPERKQHSLENYNQVWMCCFCTLKNDQLLYEGVLGHFDIWVTFIIKGMSLQKNENLAI